MAAMVRPSAMGSQPSSLCGKGSRQEASPDIVVDIVTVLASGRHTQHILVGYHTWAYWLAVDGTAASPQDIPSSYWVPFALVAEDMRQRFHTVAQDNLMIKASEDPTRKLAVVGLEPELELELGSHAFVLAIAVAPATCEAIPVAPLISAPAPVAFVTPASNQQMEAYYSSIPLNQRPNRVDPVPFSTQATATRNE